MEQHCRVGATLKRLMPCGATTAAIVSVFSGRANLWTPTILSYHDEFVVGVGPANGKVRRAVSPVGSASCSESDPLCASAMTREIESPNRNYPVH